MRPFTRTLSVAILAVAVALLCGTPAKAQQSGFEQTCLQSFPDAIQARIEIRDRQLNALLPRDVAGVGLEFVIERLKKWAPGQTITVAFQGGSYGLRKDIADATADWTNHANLTLDFGHDPEQQSFREWKDADESYAADIRISFNYGGYWSLVGTDSNNAAVINANEPSMNFGGFHLVRPADWRATVLHEFGHGLGFQHEHQHPTGGCDSEFRWYDDPGYIATTDTFGQYVADSSGRRPGIYTVLGGPPNNWPQWKVDHNLRQLTDSHAYEVSDFDADSIMKYYFPTWMFVSPTSHCFTSARNSTLSQVDAEGARAAYPHAEGEVTAVVEQRERILSAIVEAEMLPAKEKQPFKKQLESIKGRN
jgi:hypothetical protein